MLWLTVYNQKYEKGILNFCIFGSTFIRILTI